MERHTGRGRIYRLRHSGFERGATPRMLEESPAQWVQHLSHPNGWWRDNAQRILVLKQDKSVVGALTEMVKSSDNLLARFHALWTLEGLNAMPVALVREQMKDPNPRMRIQAIRASETLYKAGERSLETEYRAMMKDPASIDDVLNSRMIAWPFRLLMCCLVTDGGGALILTSADRAKDMPQKPVYIMGTGESVETPMISQMEDFTRSRAFRVAGPTAFQEAGIKHADVDHLMIYDAFAHLPLYGLEDLGFCKPGEAAAFIGARNTAPGGKLQFSPSPRPPRIWKSLDAYGRKPATGGSSLSDGGTSCAKTMSAIAAPR